MLGSIVDDIIFIEEDKTLDVRIHDDLTLEKLEVLQQTLKTNGFLTAFVVAIYSASVVERVTID